MFEGNEYGLIHGGTVNPPSTGVPMLNTYAGANPNKVP